MVLGPKVLLTVAVVTQTSLHVVLLPSHLLLGLRAVDTMLAKGFVLQRLVVDNIRPGDHV